MARNKTTYIITTPENQTLLAEFRWTISKGRDTYGYNICSLWIDGKKLSSCDGGGYDMEGTCLGHWLASVAKDALLTVNREFYGLTFHDPNYDPGKAIVGTDCQDRTLDSNQQGKTVEQAEKNGESLGLERYQAFYQASSKLPTKHHIIPLIDGACGMSCVQQIGEFIGYKFQYKN